MHNPILTDFVNEILKRKESNPINQMTYTEAQPKAIEFLLNFTKSEISDLSDYKRFKAYRNMHNNGTLKKGSYERVLAYLGYTKIERWEDSSLLVNILTDGTTD